MQKGKCICGKKIDKYLNQSNSMRADGSIYVYEDESPESWQIFRCKQCKKVISETFIGKEIEQWVQ